MHSRERMMACGTPSACSTSVTVRLLPVALVPYATRVGGAGTSSCARLAGLLRSAIEEAYVKEAGKLLDLSVAT